jgi:hypothetical protein
MAQNDGLLSEEVKKKLQKYRTLLAQIQVRRWHSMLKCKVQVVS